MDCRQHACACALSATLPHLTSLQTNSASPACACALSATLNQSTDEQCLPSVPSAMHVTVAGHLHWLHKLVVNAVVHISLRKRCKAAYLMIKPATVYMCHACMPCGPPELRAGTLRAHEQPARRATRTRANYTMGPCTWHAPQSSAL